MVRCGAAWFGGVMFGVAESDEPWRDTVGYGKDTIFVVVVRYARERRGMVRFGAAWFGGVLFGMAWSGTVW